MSELEKYIKKVIKEAKNPLAAKMKEIENQGRVAALETKLSAIAEMIEETEGRLTRIDEDSEFNEMMDRNKVKDVRKQLKELEKAQAKLQKEYDKASGGMKRSKPVVDEDTPVAEDTIDAAIDEVELEEDDLRFEGLNESVKRMQKLANLKG
jgi:chromosome segregation ATPase